MVGFNEMAREAVKVPKAEGEVESAKDIVSEDETSDVLEERRKKKEEERVKKLEILEANRDALENIKTKVKNIKEKVMSSNLRHLRKSEFFFPLSSWQEITDRLDALIESLYDHVENVDVRFHPKNNISHVIGNGIQTLSKLVDKFLEQNQKPKEDGGGRELGPAEFRMFSKNKKSWDLTFYYLDYINDPRNKDVIMKEISSEEGYLGEDRLSSLFSKVPQEDIHKLELFNFITRLEGWQSNVGHLRGMDKICGPVTEENFEEEFETLEAKGFLDKEEVKKFFQSRDAAERRMALSR